MNDYVELIQQYVISLSNQDYQTAQSLVSSDSIPIEDIKRVIEEYNCKLIPLPINAFDLAQTYQMPNDN